MPSQFVKFDIDDKSLLLPDKDVKLPTGTSVAAKDLLNDTMRIALKKDAKNAIVMLMGKLLEKNPMSYGINRAASCIAPSHLIAINERKRNGKYWNSIINLLYERGSLLRLEADAAKEQYEKFITVVDKEQEKFAKFDYTTDRLDLFLGGYLRHNPTFKEMWKVMILIFTLPHGQAVVERGFNINKDVMVVNLHQESLVAQRLIYDELKSQECNSTSYKISQDLRKSCMTAYNRYNAQGVKQKEEEQKTEKEREKERLLEEISNVDHEIGNVKLTIKNSSAIFLHQFLYIFHTLHDSIPKMNPVYI